MNCGGWSITITHARFLCVALATPELKKDLPASSSRGLRLKAWVTVLDKNHIFILENIPFLIFQDDKGDILGGKNLFRKWEHTVV